MKIKTEYEFEISDTEFNTAIQKALKNNPDFVLVTRCKDCKWFNKIGCAIRFVDDSNKPTENDFCSFGERRKSNADGT